MFLAAHCITTVAAHAIFRGAVNVLNTVYLFVRSVLRENDREINGLSTNLKGGGLSVLMR